MRLGPYALRAERVPAAMLGLIDSLRLRARGVPALSGDSPVEIAKEVLKKNAGKVLRAGTGRSWFMRTADFAIALRGAQKVLSPSYLRGQIEYMIKESLRLGAVPSCYTRLHGFDLARPGADGLPWLLFSVAQYAAWVGDRRLIEENEPALRRLLGSYQFDRTSASPCDLACAASLLKSAGELGLEPAFQLDAPEIPSDFDADILSLYLGVAGPARREGLLASLAQDHRRAPTTRAIMRLNVLKAAGRSSAQEKADLDALVMRHRNFVEELDAAGRPAQNLWRGCEHGLSMAAGQYLELALG